jgi:RNA polymerase sigma-70 factor (family 1)
MSQSAVTDFALWDAIRQDDEHAFAALFERYWARLFKLAFAQVRDREACAEMVHDIFLTLWQKRHELEIEDFLTYLAAATRYQVYRHKRAARVIPIQYAEQLTETPATATSRNRGADDLTDVDLERGLAAYLGQLPARCREIFLLSRTQQLSNHEIADRLGISKRVVENQITTALRHLRLSFKHLLLLSVLLTRHWQ